MTRAHDVKHFVITDCKGWNLEKLPIGLKGGFHVSQFFEMWFLQSCGFTFNIVLLQFSSPSLCFLQKTLRGGYWIVSCIFLLKPPEHTGQTIKLLTTSLRTTTAHKRIIYMVSQQISLYCIPTTKLPTCILQTGRFCKTVTERF